ncbi:MAG: flagellar biosynthetic protein FliO [Azonexus sp.]|jgi:flagellar protein FliO/FliZ|nr:flagellar biosynthetic protein FliO [Betaproteobacteria bacterium]MBK8918694.1 flagellar biosynthetic protein FliO [Betaproteobacteria bacterium]MBP6034627.1 flagellar biosynthetic protein FliO [Azonexus sp.]MBP6905167.1 flagellar biosynthetic protein FliO [Azonexus sp.]
MVRRLFVSLFLASLTLPAAAQAQAPAPGVGAGTFVQALAALGLIVLLLLALAWVAQRIGGGRAFGTAGMKVVGGLSLGPREKVVLVEVGDTWLVIGVVPGQIRTLHTLPKGETPESSGAGPERPFARWLKEMVERPRG